MLYTMDILLYTVVFLWIIQTVPGLKEYCLFKTFNATCNSDEVIIMTEAKYGRMRSGGCLGDTTENLACVIDVLPLLHKLCSGKPSCQYIVGSEGLFEKTPCGTAFLHAFYAEFQCVEALPRDCSDESITLQEEEGYIASHTALTKQCLKPMRILGQTGRIIHVAMMDFHEHQANKCNPKGWISDVGLNNNISVCTGVNGELYTSSGNILKVHLYPRIDWDDMDAPSEYVIHYKVLGCVDLIPPVNGWYERNGERAVFGCDKSDVKWHLRCVGNLWQGVVGKCDAPDGGKGEQDDQTLDILSEDNIIMIVVVLVVGTVLIISSIGLIYIIIKCKQHQCHSPSILDHNHHIYPPLVHRTDSGSDFTDTMTTSCTRSQNSDTAKQLTTFQQLPPAYDES